MSNIIYFNYFNQSPPQAGGVLERFITLFQGEISWQQLLMWEIH